MTIVVMGGITIVMTTGVARVRAIAMTTIETGVVAAAITIATTTIAADRAMDVMTITTTTGGAARIAISAVMIGTVVAVRPLR